MKRRGPILANLSASALSPETTGIARRPRRAQPLIGMLLVGITLHAAAPGGKKATKNEDAEAHRPKSPAAVLPAAGSSQGNAEIFADRMEMDFNARVARFEGHVRIVDPRMTLTADTLIAYFDENNRLKKVEALENVVIAQPAEGRRATAGHAVYDMDKGTIELTENPSLQTGQNLLYGAEKITYFRNSDRVICEGGHPRIRIVTNAPAGKLPGLLKKLDKHSGTSKKP